VVVIVDEAGDCSLAVQVNGFSARVKLCVSHRTNEGEAALLDCHLGDNLVLPVERVDFAVDQPQIRGAVASSLLRQCWYGLREDACQHHFEKEVGSHQ